MTLMTAEKQICPVCGLEQANTDLETRTNEQELRCRNKDCGFFASAEIITDDDGRQFWVETTSFPISPDGTVRRGSLDKKNKREHTEQVANASVDDLTPTKEWHSHTKRRGTADLRT